MYSPSLSQPSVGVHPKESNVDIGGLDGGAAGVDDLVGTLDDVDTGDLGGGIEDIDVGDLGADFGGGFGSSLDGVPGLGGEF